jgi:hypothetical protein
MMRSLFVLALCVAALADSLTWTGHGNTTSWDDYRNWDKQRIPVSSDNIVINMDSASVTLNIPMVSVASVHISAGAFIQPNPFTVGQLTVDGTGVYRLDSGNGFLTVTNANISSKPGFLFASGYLTGSLNVNSGSQLNFTTAASKSFTEAKVTVAGTSTCDAGATINFNGSSLNFAGGLTFQAGDAVNLIGTGNASQITGSATIAANGQVQLLVATNFVNFNMGSGSALQVVKEPQTVQNLNMADTTTLSIQGERSSLSAGTVTSTGVISTLSPVSIGGKAQILSLVIDGNVPVILGGDAAFGSVIVKAGSLSIAGSATADNAQFGTATVGGSGSLAVAALKVTGPNMFVTGASITVTNTATFNGQIQFSSGLVSISQGATASVSQLACLASGGVFVNGTSWNNDGTVTITGDTLSFSQVSATGNGAYNIGDNNALSLSNAFFSANTVTIGKNAVFNGQVSAVNVTSTSASDKFVDFTVDTFTFHCSQSCPAIQSNGQTTSFSASGNSS